MAFTEPMKHVRLLESIRQQLDADENELGQTRRAWTAMVVPPKPWSSPIGGGYLSMSVPLLMRRHRELKALLKLVDGGLDLGRVYNALNRLQATPWRINRAVLSTAQAETVRGLSNGRLLPDDVDGWDDEGADDREERLTARSRRQQFTQTVEQAADLVDEPSIYFPWRLDTRGRMYPLSEPLSPQGSNLAKALLVFAEPAALGTEAAVEALLCHGANVFGHGKDRLARPDQLAYMRSEEMTARVRSIAANPEASIDGWSNASKPWLFLAFALEYARLLVHVDQGKNPLTFESALPVSIDATCSAFQHVALLTRDEKLAELVNLVGDARNDLYMRVAEAMVDIASTSPDPMLQAWSASGLIGRDLAKKPSMTALYGSRQYGLVRTVKSFLAERRAVSDDPASFPFDPSEDAAAARELVTAHRQALSRVAPGALQYLKLARNMGRRVAAAGADPLWHLPTGFVAIQSYREPSPFRIHTRLFGKSYWTNAVVDGPTLDVGKNARSFAANFIHSLDAEHLRLTFELLPFVPLASVHDCLQVRAADAQIARSALLAGMRELHRDNRLRQAWEQFRLISWRGSRSKMEGDGNMSPWSIRMGSLQIDDVNGEYAFT